MPYFRVEYSCSCGPNEEYIQADSLAEAEKETYQLAIEEYERFAGYHGIPSVDEVAEDMFARSFDELTEDEVYDAELEYYEQMESWLSYSAGEVTEQEYLIGIGAIKEE